MPISSIGSYPTTMQEFIAHWGLVNTALGANPLLLRGAYTVVMFTTDRSVLVAAINASIAADNALTTASGNLKSLKAAIFPRLPQFRNIVNAVVPNSGYSNSVPRQPTFTVTESRFLNPLQDMLSLWSNMNSDVSITPNITLAGSYNLLNFVSDVNALRAAYIAYRTALENARYQRKTRDALLKPAEQRMKQYREMVKGKFAATDPLVKSLPALTPSPGSTPDAVTVTADVWDAVLGKAKMNFTASPTPNIDHYSLRTAPGPVYKVKNESVLASLAPTAAPLQFLTDVGLEIPNSKALYRIYTVTMDGHEKGTPTLTITRPA